MPGLSGWKKNSVSSRAQHQPRHLRLRKAIPQLTARPHRRKIVALLCRACNDLIRARPVGTQLPCKGHGRLLLVLRLPAVHRRPIMGLQAPAMMVLCTSEGLTDGLRRNERLSCQICCSRRQRVNVSRDLLRLMYTLIMSGCDVP